MTARDTTPWLLSLESWADEQPAPHLYPIRSDELEWAREAVEFLSNCFAKELHS